MAYLIVLTEKYLIVFNWKIFDELNSKKYSYECLKCNFDNFKSV